MSTQSKIVQDALAIWKAGVDAVTPRHLISKQIRISDLKLKVREVEVDLSSVRRLVVVGGGKAACDMATAFEANVLPFVRQALPAIEVEGLVTSPELTDRQQREREELRALYQSEQPAIEVLEARPAGLNAPTEKAVAGTQRILETVRACGPEDVVVCLLSGGGSALLTAPVDGITLQDKQSVASVMSAAGATIEQLNAVRRSLSGVKGGGLARACNAGVLVTAAISDVLGNNLETIASGPTVLEAETRPSHALKVLGDLRLMDDARLLNVVEHLKNAMSTMGDEQARLERVDCKVHNVILGSNRDAVDAACQQATELGYKCSSESATHCEPDVSEVGMRMFGQFKSIAVSVEPICWISGGEPTVALPENPGRGGRNQQLVLQMIVDLLDHQSVLDGELDFAFLSGGSDGEDGPTNAAGAYCDPRILALAADLGIAKLREHLAKADSFQVLKQLDCLMLTGATGTNVCDLRVMIKC